MDYKNTHVAPLAPTTAVTATGSSNGVDLGGYSEMMALLNVTAFSGVGATLDVRLETSHDGTDWYDMGSAFGQATGVTKPAALKITNFGRFVRGSWTLSAGASFDFTLNLVAKT